LCVDLLSSRGSHLQHALVISCAVLLGIAANTSLIMFRELLENVVFTFQILGYILQWGITILAYKTNNFKL